MDKFLIFKVLVSLHVYNCTPYIAVASCAVSYAETLLKENVLHWKSVYSLSSIFEKLIYIGLPLELS